MDHFQTDPLSQQILDMGFMPQQLSLDEMAYQLQDSDMLPGSPIKIEDFGTRMLHYGDESDLNAPRSFSCSSASTQSMSPLSHQQQPLPALTTFQSRNSLYDSTPDRISPNTAASSRKESDDESHRAERRRAQNRAAQRAYRQRKDHSLKQREHEIDDLRAELDKAQKLNKTLCKVVGVLRERLKEPELPIPEDG